MERNKRRHRRGSQVTSILYFFDDFDWMGDATKKGKEKGENTGKTHKKTTWQPLMYHPAVWYETKRIVYGDACAGETNGAWGSRA